MPALISPHGASDLKPLYVADPQRNASLRQQAESLPSILVSSAAASNAVMLAAGYFTPLSGYMDKADALSVAEHMQTTNGLFWPTPVLNLLKKAPEVGPGQRIALRDPNVEGNPVLAIMEVREIETFTDAEFTTMTQQVFGTTDPAHPGVADFIELGALMVQDALDREESCGGHFREEYQTPDGEAMRNDEEYAYVAAWEHTEPGKDAILHKENLVFENVELKTRSYK